MDDMEPLKDICTNFEKHDINWLNTRNCPVSKVLRDLPESATEIHALW